MRPTLGACAFGRHPSPCARVQRPRTSSQGRFTTTPWTDHREEVLYDLGFWAVRKDEPGWYFFVQIFR